MEVKGVAFIARRKLLTTTHGEEKFKELMRELAAQEPYFKEYENILSTSLIPAEKFIAFNDFLLKKLYDNNPQVYWMMGEKSAEYALVEGPFKSLIKEKDLERVLTKSIPILWDMYYTAGRLDLEYTPGIFSVRILELPINHYYFEFVVMAYCKKVLELCGARDITYDKLKTIDRGDKEINYVFRFAL